MAANIEDFVSRIVRGNRKITFVFTEDFFNIIGRGGVLVDRYKSIRNAIRNVGHRKGERAAARAGGDDQLFDVDIVVIGTNFQCFPTTFKELNSGPFGSEAFIYGFGGDMVDAEKAKFLMEEFLAIKREQSVSISRMLAEYRKRKIILVIESPADLKRPSLEQIIALRSLKSTVLINPTRGPIVDCQVAKISDSENSNSFSTLMSMFCAKY